MAYPIWKDYFVVLGKEDSYIFRIMTGEDEVIYKGKAFLRPGQEFVQIRINDICADYLTNKLPNRQWRFTPIDVPVFKVQTENNGKWMDVDVVNFTFDWSYDDTFDGKGVLSRPINGHVAQGQPLFFSVQGTSTILAYIINEDGSSVTEEFDMKQSKDFSGDFNNDFAVSDKIMTGVANINLSDYPYAKRIMIGDSIFRVVDTCSRYVLYYINAYGGWDSFLVEGNFSAKDDLIRHTRSIEYDNRSVSNRGRLNYVNEITQSLVLHTSWLSDEESLRMHHLLNATEVFVYDLVSCEMIPVILMNPTTEYKTYKSSGHRLVNYTIEVQFANDRLRR